MEKESMWLKTKELVRGIMKDRKARDIQWKKVVAALSVSVILGTSGYVYYQNGFSHEVTLNGTKVGYVKKVETANLALDIVGQNVAKAHGEEAHFVKEVEVSKVRGHKKEIVQAEDLAENMSQRIQVFKPASILSIDGEERLVAESKEVIEDLLEEAKKPYSEEAKDDSIEVLDISIKQEIEIEDRDVAVEAILTRKEAMLVLGLEDKTEDMALARVAAIGKASRALNSRLTRRQENEDNDIEDIGETEETEEKVLDVVRLERHTTVESIDFKEVEENDSSLLKGEKKLKQEGEKGEKKITTRITYTNGVESHRDITSETVIKEAKDKITLVGTKEPPRPTAKPSTPSKGSSSSKPAPTYNGKIGASIVATAKHYLGVPYRYGGTSPSGFDCSGLTTYVYKQYGISLPRTATAQRSAGAYVAKSQLQPGDLVHFIGHVGIYIGGGNMIHSPRPGYSVTVAPINTGYYQNRYISASRPY